ncbi:MAG: MarR family transcriptional regulator [Planctomycetota bacterium]|nr:MarR family transcriptional regulator [Planctomycetota bacterium]MDP6838072.1 MarR family transcriptional regulator [Planctomycetota bacterium]MDP6956876.1 MarR family transcriptional regulator [Planctomycetota bacterium]
MHTLALARRHYLERAVLGAVDGGPISPEQMRVLRLLVFNRGIRVGEVARALGIKPSATSLMLDRMGERGFIERFRDGGDGRILRLRPTGPGLALFKAAEQALEERLQRAIGAFTTHEVDDLTRLLGKLTRGLLEDESSLASLCFHCGVQPDGDCSLEMSYQSCPYRRRAGRARGPLR